MRWYNLSNDSNQASGVAFIFKEVFDEYVYHPLQRSRATSKRQNQKKKKSKQRKRTDSDSATEESGSDYEPNQDETMASEEEEDPDQDFANAALEIPLNTVIECLNIFGSAGSLGSSEPSTKGKKWKKGDDDSDREGEDMNSRGLGNYIGGGSEKRTGMRLTYSGPGAGLKLIMWVILYGAFLFSKGKREADNTAVQKTRRVQRQPARSTPMIQNHS